MIYAGMRIGVGEDRLFVFVAEAVDRLDLYVRSGIRQRVIEHVIRGLVVAAAVVASSVGAAVGASVVASSVGASVVSSGISTVIVPFDKDKLSTATSPSVAVENDVTELIVTL